MGYMDVEGYDTDPTDHSGSIDINGSISFDTVYDHPEMDYFNGTGRTWRPTNDQSDL